MTVVMRVDAGDGRYAGRIELSGMRPPEVPQLPWRCRCRRCRQDAWRGCVGRHATASESATASGGQKMR